MVIDVRMKDAYEKAHPEVGGASVCLLGFCSWAVWAVCGSWGFRLLLRTAPKLSSLSSDCAYS